MRPIFSALAVALLMLGLGACGDSSEDKASTQTPEEKAQATVCAARADIGTEVEKLKGLTAATVTKDAVTRSLDAIKTTSATCPDRARDRAPAARGVLSGGVRAAELRLVAIGAIETVPRCNAVCSDS